MALLTILSVPMVLIIQHITKIVPSDQRRNLTKLDPDSCHCYTEINVSPNNDYQSPVEGYVVNIDGQVYFLYSMQ
jgi:hypothetical protein